MTLAQSRATAAPPRQVVIFHSDSQSADMIQQTPGEKNR